jgi:hypothetical protein
VPEPREPSPAKRRLGCGLAAIGVLGGLLGLGLWLGRRDLASATPCDRFAELVARELKNCHSGQNTSHDHLVATCQREAVAATDACLARIDALTCDQLEGGVLAAAGEACRAR